MKVSEIRARALASFEPSPELIQRMLENPQWFYIYVLSYVVEDVTFDDGDEKRDGHAITCEVLRMLLKHINRRQTLTKIRAELDESLREEFRELVSERIAELDSQMKKKKG